MKIIFMGTPEFAVPSLREIINSNHEVVAVFTQMPKAKDRGMSISKSPVHILAEENGIEVFCPKTLRTEENQQLIHYMDADIIVVVAYGFIIPPSILSSKKYGVINLHPSKLPRFRGAAPLQHTILEQDTESSICIIKMDEGLDTGPILMEEEFGLPLRPTISWLHDYTSSRGAKMILEVLDNISSLTPRAQSGEGGQYARKISKEDGLINWYDDLNQIDAKIRALSFWPGAYFRSNLGDIKILKAEPVYLPSIECGRIIDGKDFIVSCKGGGLKIELLQLPGKKPISGESFLNGYRKSITIVKL